MIKHLVTLVQDKAVDAAQTQLLLTHERIKSTGSGDNDVWVGLGVGQKFNILLNRSTSVEDTNLDTNQIFRETIILVPDLISQLAGVAHDKNGGFIGKVIHIELLESCNDKDSSFTKTGLGLAEDILTQNCLRDADLLDCSSRR